MALFKGLRDLYEEGRKSLREQIEKSIKKLGVDSRVDVIHNILGEIRDDYLDTIEKVLGFDPKSDIYLLQDFNRLLSSIGLNPPYPQIDILDDEGKLSIILDVPGFSKDSLDLECAPNKIHVKGKAEIEEMTREIDKIINLPRRTVPNKAEAKLKNGILFIKIPIAK
ncbi:MAG: Hsp20/alpha crystallin family protein [Candidatus Helarchaeota archaeon]